MTAVSGFLASHRDWTSWLLYVAVQHHPSNTNIRFRYPRSRTSKSRSFGVIRSRVFQLPVTSLTTSRSGTLSLLRVQRNYTLYNVICLAIVNEIYNFTIKIRISLRINVTAILIYFIPDGIRFIKRHLKRVYVLSKLWWITCTLTNSDIDTYAIFNETFNICRMRKLWFYTDTR